MIMEPTAIVVNYELFKYVKKTLDIVFDILARKEQDEADAAALTALALLKAELDKKTSSEIKGIPFATGLTAQEYSVLRNEMKPGKHLYDYSEKMQIASVDHDLQNGTVIFQGVTDSVETMFRVGHWVGLIHQMNVAAFGKDYKIDPDWDRPNN